MFFSAPVYHEGLTYMVDYKAMLYVMDAKTGKLVYRQRLPLEPRVDVRSVAVTAPLALAGKRLYAFDNQGNCVVFEPGREYKQLALNRLETFVDRTHTGDGWQELGPFGAPVFEGGRIYVRSEAHLYCIGEK
jgi:outer membrane protein assembly factor BamB